MANLSSSNIDPSLVGPIKIVDGDNPADAVIPSGNVGIGVQPTEKLSVQGVIESKTGGIKFPDATVQTTAASGGGDVVNVSITKFTDSNGVSHSTQTLITPWIPSHLIDIAGDGRRAMRFSPDGKLVVIDNEANQFLKVYSIDGNSFTEKTNLPTSMLATGLSVQNQCSNIAWSSDGIYLAAVSQLALFLYKLVDGVFIDVSSNLNASAAVSFSGVAWSIDNILSITTDNSGDSVLNYLRTGDTFQQLNGIPHIDITGGISLEWSHSGEFLAIGCWQSGVGTIPRTSFKRYQKTGLDTFTFILESTTTYSSFVYSGQNLSWSINDKFLAIAFGAGAAQQRIVMFERSGNVFTDISTTNFDVPPNSANFPANGNSRGVAFSPDGKFFGFTLDSAGKEINIYAINGSNFTLQTILPNIIPGNDPARIEWSPDGKLLGSGGGIGSPIKTQFWESTASITLPAKTSVLAISDLGTIPSIELEKRIATAIDITTSGRGIYAVTDTSIARTVTLSTQDSLFEGNLITIKDESGLASVNNITVLTEGAETIDGSASVLISTNFGSIKLYSNGIDWFII